MAKFIVLEGSEGVGKSTNLALIADILAAHGDVVQTREPGGTPLAESIRQLLLSKQEDAPVPLAELLLMFAARAQHIEKKIKPALAQGQWVLCDRFTGSTRAYQGFGREMGLQAIDQLAELVHSDCQPDLVIYLDAPVEVGLQRAGQRSQPDRFESEKLEFFNKVRQGYLAQAETDPSWWVIDASQPLAKVQSDLRTKLEDWL
ncbi:dTMP kinase [Salinibius halmophilus]|nr:dTMP kinase [Salinibius halmophilus]